MKQNEVVSLLDVIENFVTQYADSELGEGGAFFKRPKDMTVTPPSSSQPALGPKRALASRIIGSRKVNTTVDNSVFIDWHINGDISQALLTMSDLLCVTVLRFGDLPLPLAASPTLCLGSPSRPTRTTFRHPNCIPSLCPPPRSH
jgi:hypothetical protein